MNPLLLIALGSAVLWIIFGDEKKKGDSNATLRENRSDCLGGNGGGESSATVKGNHGLTDTEKSVLEMDQPVSVKKE